MHDNILRAVAKTIAANSDELRSKIDEARTEFDVKIQNIDVGVNQEFVDKELQKAIQTIHDSVIQMQETLVEKTEVNFNSLQSKVKLVELSLEATGQKSLHLLTAIENLDASSNKSIAELSERVEKAELANDETLNLVADRLEQFADPLASAAHEIVKAGVRIDEVRDRVSDLEMEVGNSVSSLQKQILNSTEKSAELVSDVANQLPVIEAKVDGLVEVVGKQLHDVLEVKDWSAGIHRLGVRVKHNYGDQYIAKVDTAEEPSPFASDWILVERGLRFRGLHDESATYSSGDFVVKDGSTWMYDGNALRLMAMRGEKGSRGKDGPQGLTGKSGLTEVEIRSIVVDAVSEVEVSVTSTAIEAAESVVKSTCSSMFIHKDALRNVLLNSTSFNELKTNLLSLV